MANVSLATSSPKRLMSRFKTAGLIGLIIAAGNVGMAGPVLAQEMLQRVLTVTGQGEEKIQATEARVNLAVEAEGQTADEVQAEVARRADAVVQYLRSQKVRNLKTTGINLNPNYSYTNNKRKIIGYRASNSVQFTVDSDQTGALLDRVVAEGASRINGISFKASDEAIDVAQKEALKDATRDARSQAQAVFSALGLSEKEIVGIQVNGAVPRPIARPAFAETARLRANADVSSEMPVVAGDQTVRASVTLQIQY